MEREKLLSSKIYILNMPTTVLSYSKSYPEKQTLFVIKHAVPAVGLQFV